MPNTNSTGRVYVDLGCYGRDIITSHNEYYVKFIMRSIFKAINSNISLFTKRQLPIMQATEIGVNDELPFVGAK